MCCIFSVCGPSADLETLKSAMLKSTSRGPDDSRALKVGNGFMGFQRLSIMGLTPDGMQPFELDGNYCACNGEIYRFEEIKSELKQRGYQFASGSDCEVLLPMYKEYGTKMFEKLDAEFACVIYDHNDNKWIAARDPIGIRPLYYGYTKAHDIVFASEPKCLTDLVDGKILPFPPGHYYENGEFICYRDIAKPDEKLRDQQLETVCTKIRELLVAGVEKRLISDAKVGFLLSGGLDSSLVCSIAARKSESPIKTFAIGMREDAIDLKYAKQTAEYLKADHTEIIINRDDVINSLDHVIYTLGTFDITTIRASMGMYLLCKAIHETTDLRVILTGEVSDELFGYKYTDFAPSAAEFQKEAEKRVRELHMYDVLRADRCISTNSLEARVPFGDLDFVHYVMSIDPEMKRNHYNKGKYLLRHAFEGLDYLPPEILWREKAAFSDAVGHSMVDHLKAYAEEQYDDAEFEVKRRQYDHAMPFTKESLLYREIFEKYYPGQSQMIKDFWMPNKEWDGCNVNDPSARVLSNYGNSGK